MFDRSNSMSFVWVTTTDKHDDESQQQTDQHLNKIDKQPPEARRPANRKNVPLTDGPNALYC